MKKTPMTMAFIVSLGLTLGMLTSLTAEAKVFRNAYVSFELPDSWKCTLEHTEWVCRSQVDTESKEAIIILTAKEVGPTDSFDAYTQHLNTPQSPNAKAGGGVSKIIYAPKQVRINDQTWIDGLHMGSEINNYFTRYVATIKDRIAVLVTFSAHNKYYTKYSQDFFKAVQSLRVIATKNLLAGPESGLRSSGETLGAPIGSAVPADLAAVADPAGANAGKGGKGGKTKSLMLALAAALAGLGIFIFLKMKK